MTRPDQATRLRRVLAMLPWLLREGSTTVDAIAARFGLPADDVVRDLGLIGMCGLPPYGPGELLEIVVDEDEVFAFDQGLFSQPLRLTPAEGFAVLAAGRALLEVPGADPAGPLASALATLEDALEARGSVVVDLPHPEYLDALRRATHGHETVQVTYYSAWRDDVTERRIDPLLVHTAEGRWYVEARDHQSGEVRTFRIDRVHSLEPTGECFEPEGVVVEAPEVRPTADVRSVTLAMPPSARWAADIYAATDVADLPDGRVRMTLGVTGRTWLERLVLRAGHGVEVLDPEDLRAVPADAARRLLARYGSDGPT